VVRRSRLVALSALLTLRSPRTIALALGGAAFLAYTGGAPSTPFHLGLYASLLAAITLYRLTLQARGFLEYASSTHGCPAAASTLAAGGGLAAAAIAATLQAAITLAGGAAVAPTQLAGAAAWGLALGAPTTLLVMAAGTTLPLIATLYLVALAAGRSSPAPAALAVAALGALSLMLECRRIEAPAS
jgi:hypothetical protein